MYVGGGDNVAAGRSLMTKDGILKRSNQNEFKHIRC